MSEILYKRRISSYGYITVLGTKQPKEISSVCISIYNKRLRGWATAHLNRFDLDSLFEDLQKIQTNKF